MENWLATPRYEGRYEVSDLGRVRTVERVIVQKNGIRRKHRSRLRKLSPRGFGYLYVTLIGEGGKYRMEAVHSLVMTTHVGPRPLGMHVRHLNGDAADNRLSNLTYGTPSENQLDAVRHGTHKESRKTHCSREHEYSKSNTYEYISPKTGQLRRRCKTCHLADASARRHRHKEQIIAGNDAGLRHGSSTAYAYGCRCDTCRTASSERQRLSRIAAKLEGTAR